MLNDKQPVATVAVSDLQVARRFYEDKLRLTPPTDSDPHMVAYPCGGSSLFVYQSEYAGTNKATSVTWNVGSDLTEIVRKLGAKGVAFESYDFPGVTKEGDIHIFGQIRNAWFKDPDGNIHALVDGG